MCGKKLSKYILYTLKKKTCVGCFRIKEIRDKNNETGLKEGGGIEISNYSTSIRYNNNYKSIIVNTINISNLKKNNFHDNYNLVLKLQWFPYTRCTLSFAFVFTYHP